MENRVIMYVSSGSSDTSNKVNSEKYEFAFDRNVILGIMRKIREKGWYNLSYYDFHGNEVTIPDTEEGINNFVEFVRQKSEKDQSILVIKKDANTVSSDRINNDFRLDVNDFIKAFNCEVPAEMERIEIFDPAGTNVFRTKLTEPKKASTVPTPGALVVTRIAKEDAIELLKNEQDSQIFVTVENGDFIQIKFRPRFQLSDNGVFQWEKKPEDTAFKCHQVVVPVVLQDGEIMYGTEKSRELVAALGTNFQTNSAAKQNFESSDHTYVKRSQNSTNEIEGSDTMEKYVRLDSLNVILNNFKAELMDDIMSTVFETFKKCEISENLSAAVSMHEENSKVETASFDGVENVKSEGEDSEVLKLLNTLSNIEERLYVVEAMRQADKSTKHNKLDYGYYGHCERRIRELNSLAKKTTLNMLRKRENGKMVELETDLFVISKSGYRVKMAPNSTSTIRISLLKYGKHKNTKPDTKLELYPSIIPREVDCCVKPVFKGLDKLPFQDKHAYTQKDIRFKTKEKTGQFRCYFNVMQGGKVWGNALRIDVRVRKHYAHQNYLFGDETNSINLPSVFEIFPEKRDVTERDQLLQNTDNNNLIDEGIGGNQEGVFSASSDSDDTDANEPKPGSINDEGIDTRFPDVNVFHFDEDSDSSVSLLLDENEVRDKSDDELDTVKIPSCFLPNAELSKESIPVRVKRKINEMKTSTTVDSTEDQQTRIVKQSRSKSFPQKSEGFAHVRLRPLPNYFNLASTSTKTEKKLKSKKTNSKKFDNTVKNEKMPACSHKSTENVGNTVSSDDKPELMKDPNYVPLYPNLNSVQDFFEKFTTKKESGNKSESPTKEVQSPIVILPEKVIEMTSNVFKTVLNSMKAPSEATYNFQKNLDETLSSLSRVVINPNSSAESTNEGRSTTENERNSEAPKLTSASPTFASNGGTSTQYHWPVLSESLLSTSRTTSPTTNVWMNGTTTSTSKIPTTSACSSTPNQSNFWETSMTQSTSVPPPKRQFMEADLISHDQIPSNPEQVNVTPDPPTEPKQTIKENEKVVLDDKYNELPPSVRSQLLKLNEMGFMNDNYNLFLIRKYPKDLNKVIESLVNNNDLF